MNLEQTNKSARIFDYVIIGGGLTGCYLLQQLVSKDKTAHCLLLEAGTELGGRVSTIDFKDTDGEHIHYEAGGARFSDKHIRLNRLLKKLGLEKDKIKIPNTVEHVLCPAVEYTGLLAEYPTIDSIIKRIADYIADHKISDRILRANTLTSFIEHYMKDSKLAHYIISFYEYYSELAVLNALDALKVFQQEFNKDVQYYVLGQGYSSIITGIQDKLTSKYKSRANIQLQNMVTGLSYSRETKFFSVTRSVPDRPCPGNNVNDTSSSNSKPEPVILARRVIFTIPMDALAKIKFGQVKEGKSVNYEPIWDLRSRISCQPLYRIYARYPGDLTQWLPGNGVKIATNLPIKYIIPMDVAKGLVMISYTDGRFANYMNKLNMVDNIDNTHKLETVIYNNIRMIIKAFPGLTSEERRAYLAKVPKRALWVKHYYWKSGAGYWRPESRKPLSPDQIAHPVASIPLYIAGENVSNHQAWLEGCLESADNVLDALGLLNRTRPIINNITQTGGSKKGKTYTLDEVAKHNKKTDGWLVINKKVYNVTSWINKHPGGDAILAGLGKDATGLFNSKGGTGHSAGAHRILAKYLIGSLAKPE